MVTLNSQFCGNAQTFHSGHDHLNCGLKSTRVLGIKWMCNILSPVLMFCLFVPLQQGKGSDN